MKGKHLTNKLKQLKQRLNSNRTRRSAKHAQPTTTAPDSDPTDPPAPMPPSRTQSTPTTQEAERETPNAARAYASPPHFGSALPMTCGKADGLEEPSSTTAQSKPPLIAFQMG